MKAEKIIFKNGKNQELFGRLYIPEAEQGKCVIFSHGLFSSKDGYKITRLAGDIVSEGFFLLAFDFSFSGESGNNIADISIRQEVDDLKSAVAFMRDAGADDIHLMGSSMGAAVTILYASEYAYRPSSLISIAAPMDLAGISREAGIEDPGSLPPEGTACIDGIRLKNAFFREIMNIDMKAAAARIDCPVLIIHGALDSVVNARNAEILEETLKRGSRKFIVDDGDHNLSREEDIRSLSREITSWLKTYAGRV
ncbi:MAG: alpha/beta hydrolase [Spirochaetes bacterium]|jgi:pimeloyl-ACP methyl ester carboxylesterase|nr:alpha/beta hydrolase [Spirochaetota bacterium]